MKGVKMKAPAPSGVHMRSLPTTAVDFSSPQGRLLFAEGLENGTMVGHFNLISHFTTQSEPTHCGLASLVMVLNALSIDPRRIWKGSWRWYDENMLCCCKPLDKGLSLRDVVCMAHCEGANVDVHHTDHSTIDEFRRFVVACSSSEDCHMISLYDRRVLKQTGAGHFSPIGGYAPKSDMVLILDVARFKYHPHWVPLPILWEAMDTIVSATRGRRGFLIVSRHQRPSPDIHTQSSLDENWMRIAKYLTVDAPLLLSSDNVKDVKDVISTIIYSLPSDFIEFTKNVAEIHRKEDGTENYPNRSRVVKLVRNTNLYKHVENTLSSQNYSCKTEQASGSSGAGEMGEGASNHNSSVHRASNEDLAELLMALPHETWSAIKGEGVLKEMLSLVSIERRPLLLQEEVFHMRGQLLVLKRCHHDLKISKTCYELNY